ncbi:uncharacterized protein cpap isoform 5-T7 [Anableps anableps]
MSSPSELQYSQADFLTKWMPSSTRAGVILGSSPELTGSLRRIAAAVPAPLLSDDSFASDFAPLPASTDSSCLGVDVCGDGARSVSCLYPALQGISDGPLEEMASRTQDLPLMMKLEELRKWQQHMQEQLKAHQLEELLCLQEEQQRLLGIVNVPQICTEERPGLPGAQWRKDTVQYSPDRNCTEMIRGICGLQQELQLSEHREYEDDDNKSEGMWDSSEENPKHSSEPDDAFMQPNSRQQQKVLHDRPIKPGIGGQKKTFEELLEEQLKLEEQRLKSAQQQPKPARPDAAVPPKRPFLKRGEGLSRFTNSSKASAEKVKDKKEQKPQPEARPVTRSNSAPGSILKGSSTGVPQLPVQRKTAVLNKENRVLHLDQQKRYAAIGLHKRRLSSTPIKSTSGSDPQKSGGVQLTDESERQGISLESAASVGNMRVDALKSQVNGENGGGQESEEQHKDEISDHGSEFGGKEVTIKGPVCFSAPSNPTYDKKSYQDEESLRDSASDGVEEDEESDSDASNADDSTLIEEGDGQRRKVIFDDNDTWNDLDDTAVSEESDCREVSPVPQLKASGVSPLETTMLRKVAVSRAVALDDEGLETEPAPASQLMTRLFPSLKPKAQSAPPPAPPAASESKTQDGSAQQVQSRQLRERLAELEIEIERFKKENAALTKLRQENERRQEALRKERLEFEQTKAEELAKFEEYKKEENRKLQKERKLFEKHASAARAIPDKKEREEIQLLKQQLISQQEELKRRESRWTSTHSRLRQQIDSLNQENSSLRDEIRTLENLRLSAWKKSSVSADKGIQTKDGPRISDSSVPSVPKGVTFATPLDSRGSSSSPLLSSTAGRNSKDSSQAAAAGMKSSLRRSAGPGASSSSSSSPFSGRRMEDKPRPTSKSQEKPSNQKSDDPQDCSPKIDLVPEQPESCEANDPELARELITHPDGKVEKVLPSGDRVIVFPNGTRKEVSADGLSAKVTFFNGDTKQITADQRVIYFYAEAQTTHITYPDGMEVLHFPNNQTEKHFPDGRKEITFPDQTVKNLFPDGREESVLTDGTIIQANPDGTKEIHFNTGQKEIHTAEYKRREYPDGTVKTVYTDGRQETRYPTGRLRVKDKDGNVILDNRV